MMVICLKNTFPLIANLLFFRWFNLDCFIMGLFLMLFWQFFKQMLVLTCACIYGTFQLLSLYFAVNYYNNFLQFFNVYVKLQFCYNSLFVFSLLLLIYLNNEPQLLFLSNLLWLLVGVVFNGFVVYCFCRFFSAIVEQIAYKVF